MMHDEYTFEPEEKDEEIREFMDSEGIKKIDYEKFLLLLIKNSRKKTTTKIV